MVDKFTPGPWKVGFSAYNVTAASGQMKVCDIRGWGYLTGGGALGLDSETATAIQTANANLIAEAPVLLSALRSAVKWLLICDDPRSDKDLHAAEAVLAKFEEPANG